MHVPYCAYCYILLVGQERVVRKKEMVWLVCCVGNIVGVLCWYCNRSP
jgi:hypothetical protein